MGFIRSKKLINIISLPLINSFYLQPKVHVRLIIKELENYYKYYPLVVQSASWPPRNVPQTLISADRFYPTISNQINKILISASKQAKTGSEEGVVG